MAVRVVGGVGLEVGGVDGPTIPTGEECGVDDGGVRLEGHSLTQAVYEDAGHEGPLMGVGDLLLDDRGHGDKRLPVNGVGGLLAGEVRGPGTACRLQLEGGAIPAPDHGEEHHLGGGMRAEAIGIRVKEALERGRARAAGLDEVGMVTLGGEKGFARAEASLLDGLGDIKDVVARRDDEGAGVDVTPGDAGVDLPHGSGMVKAIDSSAETAAFDHPEEVEAVSGADNAVLLKEGGNASRSGAGGDVNECLLRRAEGHDEEVGGEGSEEQNKDGKQPKGLQCFSMAAIGRDFILSGEDGATLVSVK